MADIEILRDGVTIVGPVPGQARGAAITGGVYVSGAQRVRLQGLRIEGGNVGVLGAHASYIILENVSISHNFEAAVGAQFGSTIRLSNSTVTGTSTNDNVVFASDGSNLSLRNTKVYAPLNAKVGFGAAIGLYRSSTAHIEFHSRLESLQAAANPARGLAVRAQSNSNLVMEDASSSILGNIHLSDLAVARFREAGITGKVLLERLSIINLETGAGIDGSVNLRSRSMLNVDAASTGVTGQVRCVGRSSTEGPGAAALNAFGCR